MQFAVLHNLYLATPLPRASVAASRPVIWALSDRWKSLQKIGAFLRGIISSCVEREIAADSFFDYKYSVLRTLSRQTLRSFCSAREPSHLGHAPILIESA